MKEGVYTPKAGEYGGYHEATKFPESEKIPEGVVITSLSSNPKEAEKQVNKMRYNLTEADSYFKKGDLSNSTLYLQGILASIQTGDTDKKFLDVKEVLEELKDKINLNRKKYAELIKSAYSGEKERLSQEEKQVRELSYLAERQLDLYQPASIRLTDRRNRSGGLEERAVGRTSLPVSAVARAAAIISASGLVLGLLFLSPNVTGNTIAQISTKTSSFVGIGLVMLGIISGIFWAKRK